MGTLDEAIREHFDLKRRNGADPAVVAIEEREALGDPAQRQSQDIDGADTPASEEAGTHVEALTVSAEADGVVVDVDYEEPATEILVPQDERPPAAEPEGAVVQEAFEPDPNAVVVEEEIAVEPPEQETRGFTIEESQEAVMPGPPARPVGAPPAAAEPPAPATAGDAEGQEAEEVQDELEQTPEFLEETPEHDRLWFERKPPRDFDF